MNELTGNVYNASKRFRFLMFVYGILGPFGCFVVSYGAGFSIGGPWQSGEVRHYVEVLLGAPAHLPFLPLVIYSAGCLAAWLLRPLRASSLAIRVGIYTGVLLSVQFLVFVLIVSNYVILILGLVVGPVSAAIVYGGAALAQRWRKFSILHLLILTAVVAVVGAAYQQFGLDRQYLVLPFLALPATPALCPIVYAIAALKVAETKVDPAPSGLRLMIAWIGWPLAWLTSWKFALDIMLVEYQRLPTTEPSCYVSAAAASGHRTVVGKNVFATSERVITPQMQRLKFLELAMVAAAPMLHRQMRRWYDWFGPPLARICSHNVWFSDLTYLMLLPLELASLLVQCAAGIGQYQIEQIYRRSPRR